MEAFLRDWSYLGIFLGIVATGAGFPMPEELPVVIGGALVGGGQANFWMLPVCILGVIVGDSLLYTVGRVWGARLVEHPFVKKHLLAPERLESIRENFQNYGIRILLFARMTPGIRAPIFLTAGITRLSLTQFIIADGIYAIPGVSLLFFLGYFFTERMVNLIQEEAEMVKSIIILLLVVGVAGYFFYRFLRRPMVTGDPKDVPKVVGPFEQTYDHVANRIMHPRRKKTPEVPDIVSDVDDQVPEVPSPSPQTVPSDIEVTLPNETPRSESLGGAQLSSQGGQEDEHKQSDTNDGAAPSAPSPNPAPHASPDPEPSEPPQENRP